MFLKKIELYGFKSFSNRKEILLNGGITGIVGPNGSGKSNIADALRWVLGEQSSKALRGSSMRDVIFNGTQTKPQKGFCEVSLTFDNAENRLDSEYTEICVKRKMYRSGESEYYINNNSCRLKDILNFFRDTGIGKEGYSIIGQGKIDEILNNKPVHRRRVFEEAAGISKFRVRKEEAENNLQKTQSNLVRVEDILSELELQLEPLEAQMRDAKRYIDITEKLKVIETNIFLYQYERAQKRIEADAEQIALYEQEILESEADLNACTERVSEIKRELDELQLKSDEKNRALSAALQEFEKLKGERALIEERISFIKNSERERYDNLVSLNENIKSQIKLKEKCGKDIELIETEIKKSEGELKEKTDNDVNYKLTSDLSRSIEETEKVLRDLNAEISSMEMAVNEKAVEAEFLKEKKQDLEQKIVEKRALLDKEKLKAQNEERNIAEITRNGDILQRELEEIKNNITLSDKAKEEAAAKFNSARRELDKLNSRLEILKDMTDRREGYYESVKRLFDKADSDAGIKDKIIGTVADLIHTPTQYETAIEIALGAALQNIIVKNDSDAKFIIEFLRRNNIGRITFLPTDNLKIRAVSQKDKSLLNASGIVGTASELIDCDSAARKAVDFLLGRTIIAEDLESALNFAKKAEYSLKTVTLEGDVISPGGAVTGGSIKKKSVGLLSRNRIIEELSRQRADVKSAVNLYNEEISVRERDESDLLDKKETKEAELNEFRVKTVAVRQKNIAIESDIDRIENEIKDVDNELTKVRGNYSEIEEIIAVKRTELNERRNAAAETETALEKLYERFNSAQNKSAQFKEEADKINEKITELNHKKEIKKLEFDHFNISISSMENTMREYKKQIEEMKSERASQELKNKDVVSAIDNTERNTRAADDEVRKTVELRNNTQKDLDETQKRSAELNALLNDLNEKKYKSVSSTEKAKLAAENAQTKLWDAYSLTYANALKLKKNDFIYSEALKESDNIKAELRKIGLVNPNAIEDYNRVKERYDNINAQKEDLIKAADDLQIVIDDLIDSMARSFKEKFEQIDKSFRRVFSELFGGGTASLKLQNDGDIMECGIDIDAEPPGKKLQSITLLSGGEKALTAIALLFAMLQINPSPVCLLDEIDAPLDDANLIRFSEYLKRLSAENQFIVITHRKPTMSACDTLYGVAMREKGVSDLVSVKISG